MNKYFNISVTQRYVLLICSALLCYIIGSVMVGIILNTGMTQAKMRIALVIQDIVRFVLRLECSGDSHSPSGRFSLC